MNQVQISTEQAHKAVQNILLNGRILINGFPPTAAEMDGIRRGEQMLFGKALMLDKATEVAAAKNAGKTPKKKPDIISFKQPEKKE